MRMSKFLVFAVIVAGFVFLSAISVQAMSDPFPTYGTGAVQVRLYTDYFCPPCRGMEPALEPILKDLVKRKVIKVTLIDVPYSKSSPLYARYFLYALKSKYDFDHALMVRNTLFDATITNQVNTGEKIEELFRSKGIPYKAFEPRPAFDKYNNLIKEDRIDATPSCVIIKSGKKETFVGGADIIKALKGLK